MTASVRLACTVGLSLVLASCGGGGGGGNAIPGGTARPSAGSASISFVVPKANASSARRPDVVPATTQSIVVSATNPDGTPLTPAAAPVIANVTGSNCSSVEGGLSCTVTIAVQTATVLFSIAAYAGQNGTGALLSAGQTTSTITGGTNIVSVTLNDTSTYVIINLEGSGFSVAMNHVADTFTIDQLGGTNTGSGTLTPLANGDVEATITATNDSNDFTIGSVAYFRELANAGVIFATPNSNAPPPVSGATTGGDFGIGTVLGSCPTTSASPTFNLVSMGGSSFTSNEGSAQAFITGTGTLSGSSFSASGTDYSVAGVSEGDGSTGATTCTGGIFSGANVAGLAFDNLGVLVAASGGGSNNTAVTGGAGFIFPQTIDIADFTSHSFDGFTGGYGDGQSMESPFAGAPMGANTVQICPYTNFVNNVVATVGCSTATLTSQPFPGLLLGMSNGTPLVVTVAQIGGKYIAFGFNVGATNAGNFEFIQH